jgi:hypothetical protein
MQLTQLTLCFAIFVASLASGASSYKVDVPSNLSAGDVQLKAGEYTITLEGKQAIFKRGKESIQIPVYVEKNDSKFPHTMLEIDGMTIHAIDLGGTDTRILFRRSR